MWKSLWLVQEDSGRKNAEEEEGKSGVAGADETRLVKAVINGAGVGVLARGSKGLTVGGLGEGL
jgi:hypothetical protein